MERPRPEDRQGLERVYGEAALSGFSRFQDRVGSGEFADLLVETASGQWRLHSLLVARRSEFFYRALAGGFSESSTRVIELHLDKSEEVWPALVDYFYSDTIPINDDNVLPLLSLARQLLVPTVDSFCLDFVSSRLSVDNCISYLRRAAKYAIDDIQQTCIELAAQGFQFIFDADVAGLGPAQVLAILRHPALLVHCEQQVLRFVLRYLATTQTDAADAEAICSEVRLPYLDNQTIGSLAEHPQLPQELLLRGAMTRLTAMDRPGLPLARQTPPPRDSYVCDERYGLPGGCRTLTLELGEIWQHVAPLCSVRVSGVSEGVPAHVLSADPDAYFETNDSADPMPWIEVTLPPNVKMLNFSRYLFSHGHRRSGYWRMRNWATLTAPDGGGPYTPIHARSSVNEPFEVHVTQQSNPAAHGWRAIKLVGTDRQEDAVCRLCLRNLRLFGQARARARMRSGERAPLRAAAPGCPSAARIAPRPCVHGLQVEVDLLRQGAPGALVLTAGLVAKVKAVKARASAAKAAAAAPPAPPTADAAGAGAGPGAAAGGGAGALVF
ncbi:klhl40b [Scenedesmus sp. PABB004]|nr:klhl40b [Scenedesmus sp. PABB004]